MRVGLIAPIGILEYCSLTRVQYCIPQLLEDYPSYYNFYEKTQKNMDLTILDFRSPNTPRTPGTTTYKPNFNIDIVIAPSWAFNREKTLEEFKEFYLKEITSNSEIAGCIEGSTIEEAEDCIRQLEEAKISYIAIPSHMQLIFKGKRPKTEHPVIFLDNRTSPYECKGEFNDILVTSLPIRLGLLGRLNSDYLPSPDSLYFLEEENLYPKIVEHNIEDILHHYEEVI